MTTEAERRVIEAAQAFADFWTENGRREHLGPVGTNILNAVAALAATPVEAPDATGPITVAPLRVVDDARPRLAVVDDSYALRRYPAEGTRITGTPK